MIPRGAGIAHGCIYGVALCSPSVMLGIERGNVDLLLFGVVAAAAVLLRRRGLAPAAGAVLVLFAAVLKLFPIFAAVVLLRLRGRRGVQALGAVVAAFAIYAAATLHTIEEIRRVVPQTLGYAYGIKPFGDWAANLFGTYSVHLPARAWDWLALSLAAAVGVGGRRRLALKLAVETPDVAVQRDLDLFVVGASIYVGTFALFQSFDYRLVFVLMTIPQLVRWAAARRVLGIVGLLLVQLTLWLAALWSGVPVVSTVMNRWEWLTSQRPLFGFDQPLSAAASAQALLALVLIVLLVAALPALNLRLLEDTLAPLRSRTSPAAAVDPN